MSRAALFLLALLFAGCATCAHHPRYEPALCRAMDGHMNERTEWRSRGWLVSSSWCCIP